MGFRVWGLGLGFMVWGFRVHGSLALREQRDPRRVQRLQGDKADMVLGV